MCLHDDAQAAIESLNSTFVWEGMDGPMVVKWMDTALQQRRREQHLASMRAGVASGMAAGGGGREAGTAVGVVEAHPNRDRNCMRSGNLKALPRHAQGSINRGCPRASASAGM